MNNITKQNSKTRLITLVLILSALIATSLLPQRAFAWGSEWQELKTDNIETAPIHSKAAVCIDAKTGYTLFEKNAHGKYYPASTTKMLTALVAIEHIDDFSKIVTVSDNAVNGIDPESSHIALQVGEKIPLEDLMYGMLLMSGNDCAVVIAEEVSGSVEEFAKLMNAKAKELGCSDSHFTNPHGTFDKNHYTSPADLAKILRACSKNETFVEYSSTLHYVIPRTNKSKKRHMWNNHKCVANMSHYYEPVVCGKSGYITRSKFNLATYAQKDDMELITVCMKAGRAGKVSKDSIKILQYYFDNYEQVNLSSDEATPETLKFPGAGNIDVRSEDNLTAVVPKGTNVQKITYKAVAYDNMKLPIDEGSIIGEAEALLNNKVIGSVPLIAQEDATPIWKSFLIYAGFALALIIVFLIIYIARQKSKDKARRRRRASRRS